MDAAGIGGDEGSLTCVFLLQQLAIINISMGKK